MNIIVIIVAIGLRTLPILLYDHCAVKLIAFMVCMVVSMAKLDRAGCHA